MRTSEANRFDRRVLHQGATGCIADAVQQGERASRQTEFAHGIRDEAADEFASARMGWMPLDDHWTSRR